MFFQDIAMQQEWVFERKVGEFTEHELHVHDVLEIHVLIKNEATFQLADQQFDGRPGDVILFRPFEPHWNLTKDKAKPIEWISILFTPSIVRMIPGGYKLLAPFYAVEAISPFIPAHTSCAQQVHQLAANAAKEEVEMVVGWESKQFAYFIEILTVILRHFTEMGSLTTQEEEEGSVIQAIEHILAHFTEEIEINDLIAITGRERTYFYKSFKEITGVTPNVFIHRLRVQMAMYLSTRTSKPVTEIAFDCGYQSIHHFNKKFRSFRQLSPREYRKKNA